MSKPLPPDPDGMNGDRAEWAHAALEKFAKTTGLVDEEIADGTALADLLADLMHWCDRHGQDFEPMLARGRMHYEAETAPDQGE